MNFKSSLVKSLGLVVLTSQLAGCSISAMESTNLQQSTFKVVCSSFPVYEWANAIIGDSNNIELTLLMDNGVDPHNYQASAQDIITLQTCDVCIYIGSTSESWIFDALTSNVYAINLMDNLTEFLIETAEPCCTVASTEYIDVPTFLSSSLEEELETEEECTLPCCLATEVSEELVIEEPVIEELVIEELVIEATELVIVENSGYFDEHIWLSAQLAIESCNIIADAIIEIDSEMTELYTLNLTTYIKKLQEIDEKFQEIVDNTDNNVLIFGDRFPFRYLLSDYGIEHYAAFVGCSAETEASFETVVYLTEMLNETTASAVCYITNLDLANTIVQNSNDPTAPTIQFNAMETIDFSNNEISYIYFMEQNLNALTTALR
ncbi:MAG: hypothetical protein BEN18_09125 [Epulopiscium sp. Nuni2H_MBin001]|nr:MAG: hypothetical protein BEN18_09125 [Epulopiscium sp. Nuni2H_MBin001]